MLGHSHIKTPIPSMSLVHPLGPANARLYLHRYLFSGSNSRPERTLLRDMAGDCAIRAEPSREDLLPLYSRRLPPSPRQSTRVKMYIFGDYMKRSVWVLTLFWTKAIMFPAVVVLVGVDWPLVEVHRQKCSSIQHPKWHRASYSVPAYQPLDQSLHSLVSDGYIHSDAVSVAV